MILTPMGESFVRRASAVLSEVRRARDEVEQVHGRTRTCRRRAFDQYVERLAVWDLASVLHLFGAHI
jgi:DNA-binding transcriptional LysR family regulator